MKIKIDKPCNASWDKMKVGINSRHCLKCDKSIIDFRNKSRDAVLTYLLNNNNDRVCGRFNKSQLDYVYVEEVLQREVLNKMPRSKAFMVLALASVFMVSCSEPMNNQNRTTKDTIPPLELSTSIKTKPIPEKDTVSTKCAQTKKSKTDTVKPIKTSKKNTVIDIIGDVEVEMGIVEMGEVVLEPEEIFIEEQQDTTKVYEFTEVMPQYPGGVDSLFLFVKENLVIPEIAKELDLQGRVYVQFVVDRNGRLIDPKVVHNPMKFKELEEEALRILSLMPRWIPGQQRGENVNVRFAFPISFKHD